MRFTLGPSGNGYYNMYRNAAKYFTGERAYELTKASNQAQIDYDTYLRAGNLRAYNDWQKNVGSKGRTIRYPELSYPGAVYRADTGIARSYYSTDRAYTDYIGNVPYRAAGLYGIAGRAAGLYGVAGRASRSL